MQESINSQAMLKVGTILRGIYRIDNYLSSGGFGNTYVATNIEFEEKMAIKEFFMKGVTHRNDNQTLVSVSNSENADCFLAQREKFKKEARRLRQLNNPHIVKVHDLFEENGTAYYVMDYIDGVNLDERLKLTGRAMTEEEVKMILPQILDALKSIHDKGMWHLDLKPANIMLDKGGNIKLIDFGASKQMDTQKGGATTSTAISYTNGYAPREQMEQNYEKFGPWTDIYALGATLYNLLTNKRPPLPTDIDDDITADKHEALPFPANVSAEMKSLVLAMLNTNRMQRPHSIDAILADEKSINGIPKNNLTSHGSIKVGSFDDEETKVNPGMPNDKAKAQLKLEPAPQPPSPDDIGSGGNNAKGWKIVASIIIIFFILLLCLNYFSCGNEIIKSDSIVERMEYTTKLGKCQYSGSLDENGVPNGKGEAFFFDGRYYKGNFEHGDLTGDNALFIYNGGDEFKGEFRDNHFYFGKYTIFADKSYFVGTYKKGEKAYVPDKGTWYDKNGNVLEQLN